MDQSHPLIEVSEHVRQEAKTRRVAVIFDLDSTLFCVSPRTQHILRRLGEDREFITQHAEVAEILRTVEVLPSDYGIRSVLERGRVQPTPELVRRVKNYWGKHFFSSHFLDRDDLYPSANEYVTHLHSLGAAILYLTGRNSDSMREGTVRALKRWGFPMFADDDLLMKPSVVETDEGYKVLELRRLVQHFDHIWFFENEPVIIEQVRQQTPQVQIVFVNSVHSGKAAAPTDLRTIDPDFRVGLPTAK